MKTLVIKDANNRGFDINRLTCMDNSTNLFRKIIHGSELINQDTYTLVWYQFEKYDEDNPKHNLCCRLTDISRNQSDYIALPLNTKTVIGAIKKVNGISQKTEDDPEEDGELIPLLKMYLDLCDRIVPKRNDDLEELKRFVRHMCVFIIPDFQKNPWKKYWGPQSLFEGGSTEPVLSKYLESDNNMDAITFYRRFICENWAKWTEVACTFSDGQHRQSALEHAICHVDPFNSLHQGPLVHDDDNEGLIQAMENFARTTPHSNRKLEFNMRIPLVLNAATIAELNTESREIQERRDQARAVGLFGELNNVVHDLVDMHDKGDLVYFCNDESKVFINGDASEGDCATLVRLLNQGNDFEHAEKCKRCDTYCHLWTRYVIRNLVTLIHKHKTYAHTPYRRATQIANNARISHYQKTIEQLDEEMVKAFLSVMSEGRKQNDTLMPEPTVLGRTVNSTIAWYYYLLHGSENIESRYGAINQFFATDIDLVQILMWACYDENNLSQLREYLKNSSSLTPQEVITHKDNTKLQLDALIALCIFVSTSVYHARDALKPGEISSNDMSRAMRAHLIACAAFKDGLQFINQMGLNPCTELTKTLRQTLESARKDLDLLKKACQELELKDYFNNDGDGKTILHSVNNYWHPESQSSLLILAQLHGVDLILDDEKNKMNPDTVDSLVECLDEFTLLPSEPMETILPTCYFGIVRNANDNFKTFALESLKNIIRKGVHKLQKNSKNKKSSKNKDQNFVDLIQEFMKEAKKLASCKTEIIGAATTYKGQKWIDPRYVSGVYIDRIKASCKRFDNADDFVDELLQKFPESQRALVKEHCISGFLRAPCDQDFENDQDASELVSGFVDVEATEAAGEEEEEEEEEVNNREGEEEEVEDRDSMEIE